MGTENKGGSWLQEKYGVDFHTLDESVKKLVNELGEEGISQLVESEKEHAVMTIERLERFRELGGRWDNLSKSVDEKTGKWIGDEPQNWINAEEEKHARLLED